MAVREAGALLALGALGGVWAVAWGHRRAQRPGRTAMLDARTQLQVRLDALRARTAALARRDPPPAARDLIDRVVEQEVLVAAVLSRAATPADVEEVGAEIDDAFVSIEEAAAIVGERMPADDPFAGLCTTDPGHGEAAPGGDGTCVQCAAAISEGAVPARRVVSVDGMPVTFDAAPRSRPGASA